MLKEDFMFLSRLRRTVEFGAIPFFLLLIALTIQPAFAFAMAKVSVQDYQFPVEKTITLSDGRLQRFGSWGYPVYSEWTQDPKNPNSWTGWSEFDTPPQWAWQVVAIDGGTDNQGISHVFVRMVDGNNNFTCWQDDKQSSDAGSFWTGMYQVSCPSG